MNSSFSIISFMDHAFCVVYIKLLPYRRLSRFYSMLSSSRFTILHFKFSSLIHFKLIFVKCEFMSKVILLQVDVQLFQQHLLKKLFLIHYITFVPLPKINWLHLCKRTSELSVLFRWSIGLVFCQYQTILITAALS